MHPLPHRYRVSAAAAPEGSVALAYPAAPPLESHAPPEFDGPGGFWSPESLLVAAVADCYVLSFRAVARASRLAWRDLSVDVEGVLDRTSEGLRFTRFVLRPRLVLAPGASEAQAAGVLDKAKRTCLVTNSLSSECELVPQVVAETPA